MVRVSNIPFTVAAMDSNYNYLFPRHLEYLHNVLLDVVHGKTKRLIVNMPPRHGKSELITHYFPAWYLMNFPDKEVRIISANETLARQFGRKIRDTFLNVGSYFGVSLDPSSSAIDRFHINNRKGAFSSVGIGGQITGLGADLLIIDDPIRNPSDAESLTFRDNIYEYYKSTAYTRLTPNGVIIIVMTRWHYDDLCGRILANTSEDWTVLNLPAVCNSDDDPLGRSIGEALWPDPDRFHINKLNEIKAELGSYWFSAMYQGTPIANENVILRPEYWNIYDNEIADPELFFASWDTAVKPEEQNDYSVATVWKIKGGKCYLMDLFRRKVDFPGLMKMFDEVTAKYPKLDMHIIEDKVSGSSLIQTIRSFSDILVKPIQTSTSKVVRANLASATFEQKKVFMRNAAWNETVISECSVFPKAKHDDIVDSVTQAIIYAKPYLAEINISSFQDIYKKSKTNPYTL